MRIMQAQALQPVGGHPSLPGPEDRRILGGSIWLLLLLIRWNSPPEVYVCSGEPIRASELARPLSIGERQARRDLQRLRRAGYVELQNTGRGFRIRLLHPQVQGSEQVGGPNR